MSLPTKERLARALEELRDPHLGGLIAMARQGKYDDYESDLALPQHALVERLREFGHDTFIKRIIEGEFDATKAEAQAWWEREGRHLDLGWETHR